MPGRDKNTLTWGKSANRNLILTRSVIALRLLAWFQPHCIIFLQNDSDHEYVIFARHIPFCYYRVENPEEQGKLPECRANAP
jgi:hypothetical protein